MCLKNMEDSDKKPPIVDKNILDLFWKLTDKNSERRIDTSLNILHSLCKKQSQVNSEDLCKDLKYCVERLVKGLGSPRDAARLGYALLLTEILKLFPIIQIEDVLDLIKEHLSFTPNQEKRDTVFGQLFAYSAIIRSGRLASHSHLSFVVLAIYDLWQGKSYIINACYDIMKDLFSQISSENFKESLWPHLKKKFSEGFNNCSSDTLWLFLLCIRLFPESVSEKYLKKHFNANSIFSNENFDDLKKLIRQTTSCLPKLHPLSSEISILLESKKDMKELWNILVDDNLFEGDHIDKAFVGFEMVKCALQSTKRKKVMKNLLSPNFRSLFVRSYVNSKSPIHSASVQLASFLSQYATENTDSDTQMLILKFFLQSPGTISLDQLLKKKEISSLIQNLHPETVKIYCEFLKAIALKKKKEGNEDDISDTQRYIAVAQISNLVSHSKIASDEEYKMNVIKFLFLHSFFKIKEASSEILHCDISLEKYCEEIPENLRECFTNGFYKALTSLYQRFDQQTPLQHSLQCLLQLVEYADELMDATENLEPHFPLEKIQESWTQMKSLVHKLKKQSKKDGKVNESNAFLALFLELGFHLFKDPKQTAEDLEELHICCKKALSDRRHSNDEAVDVDEPPWVGVVTDILLSLLSRSSHHLRRLVSSVFQLLCPLITQDALHQILTVINPEKSSDDPMLVDETEEDEVDMDFDSGSSSDESESNDLEDVKVDDEFRQKVKKALGSAAEESDAESVVLSDSEMFKLDDALSKAFRDRVQTSHSRMKSEDRTMLDFRIRCLDLIMTYLKSEPPMYLVLQCIEPLLAAYELSHRDEQQKHLLHKIVSTLETMTKIKKFQNLDNVEKSDLKKLLEMLIAKCHKEVNLEVAKKLYSLCVFVVLCFRRLEGNKSPEKKSSKVPSYLKMYLSALEEFAKGNNSHIYPQFFVTLMESCPDLSWNIIEFCNNFAFNNDVRMYRKTQCLGLLFEAIKFSKNQKNITENQWSELGKSLIPVAIETLKQILLESDIKPVYLTELLDVIFASHSIMKEKTNESVLEKYSDLVPMLNNISKQVVKQLGKKGKSTRRKIILSLGGAVGKNGKKMNNSLELTEEDSTLLDNEENSMLLGNEENSTLLDSVENSTKPSPKKRKSASKENKKKKRKSEEL